MNSSTMLLRTPVFLNAFAAILRASLSSDPLSIRDSRLLLIKVSGVRNSWDTLVIKAVLASDTF